MENPIVPIVFTVTALPIRARQAVQTQAPR